MSGSRKGGGASSSKKIIVYAIIGIIAVAAVSVSVFARSSPAPPTTDTSNPEEARERDFLVRFCGEESQSGSSQYVTEVALPSGCEMPLGIAEDGNGTVWYVSVKEGILGSYSPADDSFSDYEIPSWPEVGARSSAFPMSWAVRVDGSGDVWFTDIRNQLWRFDRSTETFDVFRVPASYPASFDFDSSGNIYLVGINSQSLYYGDVSLMKNGTSDGFSEIKLPLDGFSGIDQKLVTAGSVQVDNERNDVWVSLLAFQFSKGQLFMYDIETKSVARVVDLPTDLGSPVGMALDNSGNLWVTDHGSNLFFKYDVASESITKYATSMASPKIYGGEVPERAFTWPYWIERADDGSLWFNQHTGNKIARFDPESLTLAEYWIPTQNKLWALCPPDAEACGVSNAIQLAVGENRVWFSEWTENKIGSVDAQKQLPFAISAPEEVTVRKGNSAEIRVTIDASGDFAGSMVASGTFTRNAALGNSTGIFSEEDVSVSAGGSKQVSYTFTPAASLAAGQYVLMLGAGNGDVTNLKAVKVNVV